MPVRLSRSASVLIALFIATWLVPATSEAAAKKPHRARPHSCHALCVASPWQATLSGFRTPHRPGSDDAADDFDDRNARNDPAPSVDLRDSTASPVDVHATPPWIRARRTANPHAARLIVWRQVVAPRPPPSL